MFTMIMDEDIDDDGLIEFDESERLALDTKGVVLRRFFDKMSNITSQWGRINKKLMKTNLRFKRNVTRINNFIS